MLKYKTEYPSLCNEDTIWEQLRLAKKMIKLCIQYNHLSAGPKTDVDEYKKNLRYVKTWTQTYKIDMRSQVSRIGNLMWFSSFVVGKYTAFFVVNWLVFEVSIFCLVYSMRIMLHWIVDLWGMNSRRCILLSISEFYPYSTPPPGQECWFGFEEYTICVGSYCLLASNLQIMNVV